MAFMPRMNMRIMSNELPALSNELWLTIETGHVDLEPSTFAVEMHRKHDLPRLILGSKSKFSGGTKVDG